VTSYGDYYRERVRPGGSGSGGGRTAKVVRVRPEREKRPDGNAEERYLYSRKSSREVVRNAPVTGSRKVTGSPKPRVISPGDGSSERAPRSRAEVRTVPARVERPTVDGRKAEVSRVDTRTAKLPRVDNRQVENRKVKKESRWSKLVRVVKTTVERESGKSRVAKDSRVSDGKSRKKESDPGTAPRQVKVQASKEQKSENKSSRESSKSIKDAPKARTTSMRSSQSKRRRVSD
jgi:hypothetical protein